MLAAVCRRCLGARFLCGRRAKRFASALPRRRVFRIRLVGFSFWQKQLRNTILLAMVWLLGRSFGGGLWAQSHFGLRAESTQAEGKRTSRLLELALCLAAAERRAPPLGRPSAAQF